MKPMSVVNAYLGNYVRPCFKLWL